MRLATTPKNTLKFLACAAGVVALALAGCDKLDGDAAVADRKTDALVQEALAKNDPGTVEMKTALEAAAAEATNSPAAKARVKGLVAQTEYAMGADLLRKVNEGEGRIDAIIFEIRQLGASVSSGNSMIEAYKKFDPKPVSEAAASKIAEAQGNAEVQQWLKEHGADLPTLSKVEQEASRLEGEINKKQEQVRQLTAQRDGLRRSADDLTRQSEAKGGKEGVDLYKQASEARKKAAGLSVQVDQVNVSLMPLQTELTIAQNQRKILNDAVAQFGEQSQVSEKSYATVNQQMDAQSALSKSIVNGAGGGSPQAALGSMQSKATALAELVKTTQADRDAAAESLNNAIQHFGEAATAAEELHSNLSSKTMNAAAESSDKIAFENLEKALSPMGYRLQKGIATQTLGVLYANQARSLGHRQELANVLKPILAKGGLTMPATLADSSVGTELSKARTTADEMFKDAHESFETVVGAPLASDGQKNSARESAILTLYLWEQLDRQSGKNSDADAKRSDAKSAVKDATDAGVVMASVPAELLPPPPAPATAPAKVAPAPAPTAKAAPAAKGQPADAATVAEVKAALTAVAESATKGDVEALKAFIHAEPAQQPTVDVFVSLMAGGAKLDKAMRAKFGEDALKAAGGTGMQGAPSAEQIKQFVDQVTITSSGPDAVGLMSPMMGPPGGAGAGAGGARAGAGGPPNMPIPLRKIEGMWKLDMAEIAKNPQIGPMLPMISMMLKPMADGIGQVATDVEAGKYATIDEVKAAIQQIMPQMPGGGRPGMAGPRERSPEAPPQ